MFPSSSLDSSDSLCGSALLFCRLLGRIGVTGPSLSTVSTLLLNSGSVGDTEAWKEGIKGEREIERSARGIAIDGRFGMVFSNVSIITLDKPRTSGKFENISDISCRERTDPVGDGESEALKSGNV